MDKQQGTTTPKKVDKCLIGAAAEGSCLLEKIFGVNLGVVDGRELFTGKVLVILFDKTD